MKILCSYLKPLFVIAFRTKIKIAFALLIMGYCCLLLYQDELSTNLAKNKFITGLKTSGANLAIDDILIGVRTTQKLAAVRLPIILKTWFQLASEQTWFFTDEDNPELQKETNGHMINTNCSSNYDREGMNCKMGFEYNHYIHSGKKWWCHFNDDNYVNVPRLLHFLGQHDYEMHWYFGRRSSDKSSTMYFKYSDLFTQKMIAFKFIFATNRAGFCVSRSLAQKIYKTAGGRGFHEICYSLEVFDDACLGFLIEYVTRKKLVTLTNVREFHSHFESLKKLSLKKIRRQISLSYGKGKNVLNVPGFNVTYDPTRFLSLHCFLFPRSKCCNGYDRRVTQFLGRR